MFVNMIYYDAQKINDYKTIAKGSKNIKIGKMEVTNDKEATLGLSFAGGHLKASKNYEATLEDSILFDYQEFEDLLENRDDYFDFTQDSILDITTLGRGHIIKFNTLMQIPEEFDLTQTIAQFKPYLIRSISKNMDNDESDAFKTFFETANPKIPVITECDNTVLTSKIDSKCLLVDYTQLEEYETSEVSILARITSGSIINARKPIYDPLKDFISLNRALRRTLTDNRPDGLKEIFNGEDYKTIEILAISQ